MPVPPVVLGVIDRQCRSCQYVPQIGKSSQVSFKGKRKQEIFSLEDVLVKMNGNTISIRNVV